jgi:GH25 family lysozyme M1 (1,4-beta-N-acetylmuramidase)
LRTVFHCPADVRRVFAHYTPSHGDLPPSLDIEGEYLDSMSNGERTAQQNVQQILDFAALVSAEIWGTKPLIYIRNDICTALGNPPQFVAYPLWIAAYDVAAPGSESVREPEEVFLVDRIEHRASRPLDDLVLQGGNRERALSAI